MLKHVSRYSLFVLTLLLISACASPPIVTPSNMPSTLNPSGPSVAHLASLWWVMFVLGTAAYLLVLILMVAALRRRRRGSVDTPPDSAGGDTGRRWIILGGIALPLVVIGIVFFYSTYTLAKVENPSSAPPVKIKVIGRRWWWEVQYLDQGITTANEIHIPVNTPVQIQLESADVIHSFWVPELNGKVDLVPTRINAITLQSNDAGVYRGECAEFCGLQHAHMGFMLVAESKADFDKWTSAQSQSAVTPTDPAAVQGQKVFMTAGCVFCHTVNGLADKDIDPSAVKLGPDLTHFASRLTLASASRTLNRGNLAGWIVDAQHVKPGVLMPNLPVNAPDLQNLLAYLETLK